MTLVFPDSLSNTSPRTAPSADDVSSPANISVRKLPPTCNALSSISQDTTLAFAVPSHEAPAFLASIQEIPNKAGTLGTGSGYNDGVVQKSNPWVVKAAKSNGHSSQSTMSASAAETWTGFVDLIKV